MRKMAASMSVANAAANGDISLLIKLIREGADVNKVSKDGMTPLSVAAFWGYAEAVEVLLNAGSGVNATNKSTKWTPLHCAAFQGHGKVVMKLMERKPDLSLKDNQGRTAVDFASALDSIWPFFAAAGCRRTPKSELIRLDIVKKVQTSNHIPMESMIQQSDFAHFSRPGSAYVVKSQSLVSQNQSECGNDFAAAAYNGDVLAGTDDNKDLYRKRETNPSFTAWQH